MRDDHRAVLLKPGDLLIIGNVGDIPTAALADMCDHLGEVKETLGLAGVAIFEADVDLSVLSHQTCDAGVGGGDLCSLPPGHPSKHDPVRRETHR